MLHRAFIAAILTIAVSAAAPRCLSPADVNALTETADFVLQAAQFPKYILGSEGPELASQADSEDRYFISNEKPYALRSRSANDPFIGSAANGYRLIFKPDAGEDVTERPLCCVTGLNRPIRCSANGDGTSLTGSAAWINPDGTLSLGPPKAKPKKAKDVTFIVRSGSSS